MVQEDRQDCIKQYRHDNTFESSNVVGPKLGLLCQRDITGVSVKRHGERDSRLKQDIIFFLKIFFFVHGFFVQNNHLMGILPVGV